VKAYYAAEAHHPSKARGDDRDHRPDSGCWPDHFGRVMAAVNGNIPTCRHVAIVSGAMLIMTAVGLFVFYHPNLRRRKRLGWLLLRLQCSGR